MKNHLNEHASGRRTGSIPAGLLADELLEQMTNLISLRAKGLTPRDIVPYLAGASLTPLPKKDSGVDISVGRRPVRKVQIHKTPHRGTT